MKKSTIIATLLLVFVWAFPQKTSSQNVTFGNEAFRFHASSFVQGSAEYRMLFEDNIDNQFGFGYRTLVSFGGISRRRIFSFDILFYSSLEVPYSVDFWLGLGPTADWLRFSIGQRQSFSGPRSMMFLENAFALGSRGQSNEIFFDMGRDLGLFVESRLPLGDAGLDLGFAVTNGRGRHTFGGNSAHTERGGLKYTGRATFYPFGFFARNNELSDVDFAREQSPKLGVGASFSYHSGAGSHNGEGVENFRFFTFDGARAFPHYQKISVDALFKFNGLTILAEWTNARASNFENLQHHPGHGWALQPREIANFLALGNGFNFQVGYLTPRNWSVDFRCSFVTPLWDTHTRLMEDTRVYTLGVARYIRTRSYSIKIQAIGSFLHQPNNQVLGNGVFSAGLLVAVGI